MSENRQDSPVTVHSKIWIERDGQVVMSDYRVRLLEAIAATGSVAAAADSMGLPNRTAWRKLREAEAAAGVPLLESGSGGAAGGQSHLTPAAQEVLAAFHRLADPAEALVNRSFRREVGHFGARPRSVRQQ